MNWYGTSFYTVMIMMWRDVVWYDMTWHDMLYDMTWYDVI